MQTLLAEYLRPWKLLSFAAGTLLLLLGADYYDAPDWDAGISLIMASLAYLTAAWSMRVILERRWKQYPGMLLATWFTVDGAYAIYWYYYDPVVLAMMRDVNFPASLSLYWLCGIVWLYRGSVREFLTNLRGILTQLVAPVTKY